MLVECESGVEERSATGSLAKARSSSAPAAAADAAAVQPGGSSYFNKREALLAVRYAPSSSASVPVCLSPWNRGRTVSGSGFGA